MRDHSLWTPATTPMLRSSPQLHQSPELELFEDRVDFLAGKTRDPCSGEERGSQMWARAVLEFMASLIRRSRVLKNSDRLIPYLFPTMFHILPLPTSKVIAYLSPAALKHSLLSD